MFVYEDDDMDSESNNKSYNDENTIIQEIISKTAVAACDASVDIRIMAGA